MWRVFLQHPYVAKGRCGKFSSQACSQASGRIVWLERNGNNSPTYCIQTSQLFNNILILKLQQTKECFSSLTSIQPARSEITRWSVKMRFLFIQQILDFESFRKSGTRKMYLTHTLIPRPLRESAAISFVAIMGTGALLLKGNATIRRQWARTYSGRFSCYSAMQMQNYTLI